MTLIKLQIFLTGTSALKGRNIYTRKCLRPMSTLVAKTNLYMLLSLFLVQFLWRAKQSLSPLVLFVSYVLPLKCRGEAGSWNIVVLISAETQWSRGHWLGQLSAHCRFVPQFNTYSALTIPALFSGTRTIIRRVRIQSAACCWCWYQVWDLCRVTSRCNLYWLPRAEECSPAQPSADLEQGCS